MNCDHTFHTHIYISILHTEQQETEREQNKTLKFIYYTVML